MSTSVDTSFVKQYEKDLIHVFQRSGGDLRQCMRLKTDVVGSSTTFQKIGKGTATTKARHGVITPMNQDHTAIPCTLVDFYAGDWVDKLDEAKLNIDERMAIAQGGAFALGRKVDSQAITAMDGTTQSEVTITVTSEAAVRNGLIELAESAWANDIPNDGNVFGMLSPRLWSRAMTVKEFASADYVTNQAFEDGPAVGLGRFKIWNNVKWMLHTGVTGVGTSASKSYVFHRDALGYATGKFAGNIAANNMVAADITWHGDRAAHFVNHMMSGGAVLIDDSGVIKGTSDDTTAIATS